MKVLKYILILSLISQASLAKCPEEVSVIKQGQVANCDGLLFSPEASKKAEEAIEDSKYYRTLSDKLMERQGYTDKQIDTLEKRLSLHIEQSDILSNQLERKESQTKFQNFLYFSLGILATGAAFYGASHLDR